MAIVARSALLALPLALALCVTAAAGPPGTWTQVTGLNGADPNTLEVGLARGGNGNLNVLWVQDKTVFNTQLSKDALTRSGPHTVFVYNHSSGSAMNRVSLLPTPGGGLRAFFAGLYPDDPHDVGLSTATSADGVSWAVQPSLASDARTGRRSSVYAAAGIGGTIAGDGTPISIWGDSAPNQAGYHVGTSDQDPDVRFGGGGATVGGPNAATDSSTGQVAIAWGDLDADRNLVQMISPAGPVVNAPGGEAPDALERVAMTGRDGAGIYMAYLHGTNMFLGRAAIWRIGAPAPMILTREQGSRLPGVARGAGGRLWAFWTDQSAGWKVFATRSNPQATAFGAIVSVKPPAGTASISSLEGEGTAPGGALDVLALTDAGSTSGNFHQRIRPGITMLAKALGKGKVRFTTRDAGAALDTKVKFAGKTAQTGADGKVVMVAAPGKKKATASRSGYHPASKSVRVK